MCTGSLDHVYRAVAPFRAAAQDASHLGTSPAVAERVTLEPVDLAEVTIVVDNAIDVLAVPTDRARRPPMAWDFFERDQLRAEHGYCLLVTIERNGRRDTMLYDGGLGRDTAIHNLDVLGVEPQDIRTMVLSHGHADHHGGLEGLSRRLGRRMPLVLHPDAWRDRKAVFPTGAELHLPPPSRQDLDREGWQVVEERGPSLLFDGSVLVTGQVPRVTDFEQGFPIQQARTDDGWEPDVWIWDDQAVVVNVRGRGLVVLSACSHAGAINVLHHARRLTGVDTVHAFVGGLHLTGGLFEGIVPATVRELTAIGPSVVVPGHCSGWRATHRIAAALPEAYVQSNVGTTLHFAAAGA
ncbi:MAG TPA: MBL fold metallo-hydrolase [Thermomicrobiaceae bacterium]|nr:MBL fold metallo-hydrolase [Thermomicrobiaceae bacterium]